MNTERQGLADHTVRLIRITEMLLKSPFVQERITVAAIARDCLIRQLFCAEQMLGAIRSDSDYAPIMKQLTFTNGSVQRAMNSLHEYHRCP